ncbi:MAG: hypothetical protein VCA36_07885, partial [Opitutales bacterium]
MVGLVAYGELHQRRFKLLVRKRQEHFVFLLSFAASGPLYVCMSKTPLFVLCLLLAGPAVAADWPQWLGP